MRLLGLVHEVNAVGEPGIEDLNHIGTRLCRQFILRLVHLGFLPAYDPLAQACDRMHAWASYRALMLDLYGAFFVPTLDPARRPAAMGCGITCCAAGDGL